MFEIASLKLGLDNIIHENDKEKVKPEEIEKIPKLDPYYSFEEKDEDTEEHQRGEHRDNHLQVEAHQEERLDVLEDRTIVSTRSSSRTRSSRRSPSTASTLS